MIVIGYQGIGKSSLAKRRIDIIDLESSLTKIDGKRGLNWEKIYTQTAEELSRQGYIVLISSHFSVQEALKESSEPIFAIFPSKNLKNEWISKLLERWNRTKLDKDRIAYMDACVNFEEEIAILEKNLNVKRYEITDQNYNLEEIIENMVAEFC